MTFIKEITKYLEENPTTNQIFKILLVILSAYLIYYFVKKVLMKFIEKLALKSKTNWDDVLVANGVFTKIAKLVPFAVLYNFVYLIPEFKQILSKIILSYMLFIGLRVIDVFLKSVNDIYQSYEISKSKPIKGYIQTIKIIGYILGVVVIISIIIGKSPFILLSGIGAMTAVLLLIFKDTILSLVASIQLTSNNMIKIGDWVSMPKYDADGDVIDIALHTVKIQNFDKTITTIPTHKLIDESFKNWRGMTESGGRRISRSVNIDMSTIKFLTDEMIEKFKSSKYLKQYIEDILADIEAYNKKIDANDNLIKRRLTNIGIFRAYLNLYLKNNPKIHKDMTFLVRQLAPTEKGLPIQIYVFTTDNNWINYEKIQGDIFDHILAILPEFYLKIFQNPSGNDFRKIV